MPREEYKVRENCVNATVLTKAYKELLASGDKLDEEEIAEFI